MRWSYKVARIAGIDVKIHVTFVLILAWFGVMGGRDAGWSGAVEAVGITLLLFLCVLLHEFGHAFAARAFGIRTPDITLLPIGGVARLERMPDKPVQELIVAVAGPAVNVVIALGLFAFLAVRVRMSDLSEMALGGSDLLASLMVMNVLLVLFNAIPAFPMDGGRVLRALLAMVMDRTLATIIAARIGQVIAVGFAVASFFGGPSMLLFIAVFVFLAAQQELAYAKFRAQGGVARTVSDVMHAHYASIPAETPVAHALALARASEQGIFPVVDRQLRAVGIVSTPALEAAMSRGLGDGAVDGLAEPVARVQADLPLTSAMASLPRRVPIVVENLSGQMVGLLAGPG